MRRALHRYKDVYAAQIVFENGCVAHLIANYTTDARLQRYEIHGRDISAYLEGISEGVVFSDSERHTLTLGGKNDTVDQARFFLDCIKEDRPVTLPRRHPRRGRQDDAAGRSDPRRPRAGGRGVLTCGAAA